MNPYAFTLPLQGYVPRPFISISLSPLGDLIQVLLAVSFWKRERYQLSYQGRAHYTSISGGKRLFGGKISAEKCSRVLTIIREDSFFHHLHLIYCKCGASSDFLFLYLPFKPLESFFPNRFFPVPYSRPYPKDQVHSLFKKCQVFKGPKLEVKEPQKTKVEEEKT